MVNLPLKLQGGVVFEIPDLFEFGFWLSILVGIAFLGLYARRISTEIHTMSDALLATQLALAREQKLTDLGGVVAAAAHELGTPLATIKLVSSELVDELAQHPEWRDDAALIRDQADRCRDILRQMGKAGTDDLHLHRAPFSATIRESAEPHGQRGKALVFAFAAQDNSPEPTILRRPELIHGVRNLVQNAVDFAVATVWIEGFWTREGLTLRISDDGAGFPPALIGRIGDPFLRARRGAANTRPGYEGMGMGLFIAKTLLERTGARLTLANAFDPFLHANERPARCGAIVEVIWPLDDLRVDRNGALGQNQPLT